RRPPSHAISGDDSRLDSEVQLCTEPTERTREICIASARITAKEIGLNRLARLEAEPLVRTDARPCSEPASNAFVSQRFRPSRQVNDSPRNCLLQRVGVFRTELGARLSGC